MEKSKHSKKIIFFFKLKTVKTLKYKQLYLIITLTRIHHATLHPIISIIFNDLCFNAVLDFKKMFRFIVILISKNYTVNNYFVKCTIV